MSNVIAFLESLGNDAAKSKLTDEAYVAAVDALGLDDAPRQALLDRNAAGLNDLLGGRSKMICALFPADQEPQKEGEDDQEPQEDQEPGEKKESVRGTGLH